MPLVRTARWRVLQARCDEGFCHAIPAPFQVPRPGASSLAWRLGLEENGYVLRSFCLLRPWGLQPGGRPRGPASSETPMPSQVCCSEASSLQPGARPRSSASRKIQMTSHTVAAARPCRLQPRGRPRGCKLEGLGAATLRAVMGVSLEAGPRGRPPGRTPQGRSKQKVRST